MEDHKRATKIIPGTSTECLYSQVFIVVDSLDFKLSSYIFRRDEENNEESCFLRSNSQETQNMLSSSGFGYQPLSPMSASTSPHGYVK